MRGVGAAGKQTAGQAARVSEQPAAPTAGIRPSAKKGENMNEQELRKFFLFACAWSMLIGALMAVI